jgi:hypothetical protein
MAPALERGIEIQSKESGNGEAACRCRTPRTRSHYGTHRPGKSVWDLLLFGPIKYPFQLTEKFETNGQMQKKLEWLSHLIYIPKITLFGYSGAASQSKLFVTSAG